MGKSHLSHKEITEADLIRDHRNLMATYLKKNTQWDFKKRKQALKLYDREINKFNIRYYVNRHIKIFIIRLITGELHKAAKYFPKNYSNSNPN